MQVKASVKEPYVQLQAKTTQLDRLQQAGEVLRRVIRVLELVEKLKKYMGIVDGKEARGVLKELAQAAMCMFEIRSSISLADLTGIDAIDQQKGYINECDTKIQVGCSTLPYQTHPTAFERGQYLSSFPLDRDDPADSGQNAAGLESRKRLSFIMNCETHHPDPYIGNGV
jgi:hypothetical protein